MEIPEDAKDEIGYEELSENCISIILSFTTVKDACSLAAVSPSWRSAADADLVWEKMITQRFGQNISQAISPVAFPSKKQLYITLFKNQTAQRVWLDGSTGKIGCMISARGLRIIWGNAPNYWEFIRRDDSRFEVVARLRQVWWFDLGFDFYCSILSPNTHYTVSFILKIDNIRARYRSPFIFSFAAPDGSRMESARFLDDLERSVEYHGQGYSMTPLSHDEEGWTEFVVGEFFLEEMHASEGAKLNAKITNIDCSFVKSGILVGGAKIGPKH